MGGGIDRIIHFRNYVSIRDTVSQHVLLKLSHIICTRGRHWDTDCNLKRLCRGHLL